VSWKSRGIENVNKEWLINLMNSTAIPKANGGYRWNELVYSAKFSFEPVIGRIYHCTVMLLV
jgi:hypothetical protein